MAVRCWAIVFSLIKFNGTQRYIRDVFQVEVLAIQAAVKAIWDSNIPNENITIPSDSQVTIRALASNRINSRTVYGGITYISFGFPDIIIFRETA